MSALLEVDDLVIDIPVPSGILHPVRGISFHVEAGETLGVVGESGCGKSLTSLSVMGLLPSSATRTAAKLDLEGNSLLSLSEAEMSDLRGDRLSMIFQDPMTSLNPSYSIGNQLAEVMIRHRGVSVREATDRAVFLLEKVGISAAASRLGQYPHQLSGGLRQRVMIAMALMCEPRLLIADEPTTALDVTIQAQILLLIQSLQKEFSIGVILITHDLGVIARTADRVAVMYAGEIVETGTAAEIFEKPLHPYTQGLIDCIPIPGRTKPGEHLGSIPGIVPTLVGDLQGCAFADRCAHVRGECRQDVSENRLGEGRQFRCVLPAELEARHAVAAAQ